MLGYLDFHAIGIIMFFTNIFSVLLLLEEVVFSLALTSALPGAGAHGWRAPMDCVRASDMCNQSPQCSSRYRIMRQCLVGRDRSTMLANRECQVALEVLQDSPLYDCRCRRGMKKELQCLLNYWSIHMGLTEGEEFYETSPYEPLTFRVSDAFRLASIISGMDSATVKGNPCADSARPCNPCLDAAKACNLNDTCKKMRSLYISVCVKATAAAGGTGGGRPPSAIEQCNRKRCHKMLRQFLDRVPTEHSYRLLFCPCRDQACAERRRQTIVPSCSYEERTKPNCLELRRICRSDALCRSRLADFHMNCETTVHSITSCPNDNYQACLASYTGLIGTDMTPNYMDASHSNFTISPWCTCRGSGNQDEECSAFLRDFRDNVCLKNAIQAFEYGPDPGMHPVPQPVTPSSKTYVGPMSISTETAPPARPETDACIFSECASLETPLDLITESSGTSQGVGSDRSAGDRAAIWPWALGMSCVLLGLAL
ncbi:GDNF family receptor alpha-2-like [Brienomyrus brachyistius]|uniref:GDNF family receptor alpha-2-like n=1 Tax=Brienomyrus brachyistius TaxID=42636 RepID=UPI0020B1BFD5|nr:GDNF family receptor alpha-2-like [Brienomyrus brachyistius]